ncbi:MAG: TRAP transporter substrate-binding protein [Bacteriovorax sp.]|jgi:TRAP-type C4-dicarboxylate transport system substrate-binding protein
MRLMILAVFSLFSIASLQAKEGAEKVYKIKWVLAHEPIGLFKEAAEVFTKEVTAKTNGKVAIEVLTLPEYETKYNKSNKVLQKAFLKKIQDGQIEMSQTYTTTLGEVSTPMFALDLPYLFRDHDHAKKVLEGSVGDELLNGLVASKIRGLAFTYSGGFRIIPGTKAITKMEDFKGVKIRTSGSPVAQETFNILGAKAVPMGLDSIDNGIRSGKINEAESTYARYFTLGQNQVAKQVNETNHSLFLTSIIVNEKFWSTLPDDYKVIMKEAAVNAARVERDHSIKDGEAIKKRCAENGIKINTLNQEEENRMKAALQPVYKKYSPIVGSKLVASILAQ